MADWEHPSLQKLSTNCTGRVPVYVHPSLYRALKLIFPTDVGGLAHQGKITRDIGRGGLGQAVSILTPEHFRPVCDTA